MNRFKVVQRAHIPVFLVFALFTVTILGCGQGGINLVPLGAKLQNADNAFDEAEAMDVQDDDPEKMKKKKADKQKRYDKAMALYLEVIERDTKGKYAQRAHYQIGTIYKRGYEWDKATEHYQIIVNLAPTGYYANEAKSGIANIRKNRQIIKEKRAEYQNYKALYDQDPTDETFNIAAEALYEVARAYEALENSPEAIRHYERMVEEFPTHSKAPQAQFQIGNVYFYTIYDYIGGWPAFVAVTEKFPESYEASQATTLLKKTADTLTEIQQLMDEIDKNRNKKAIAYQKTGRKLTGADLWVMGMEDLVVQNFQGVANNWEKLRNYPRAIQAYKTLVRDLSHKKFASADARYRAATLYQQNGEYERAIQAYDDLFENSPESIWRNDAVYQQAVCYRAIREFGEAYEGFKAYMSSTKSDQRYFREAEQMVRQFELDQDADGYQFYKEQEAGTSDQDASSFPGS